ncbi:hypothetical protein GIB67_031069 [Kingdonia uniflora]|uniref:Uncharacterized protein n=1 Tax=Kingdonia uniflora TaxID=39325 RepID=A0A7J7LMH7_9MAGN|nr:hypothetical protein GIB67_031069 [Kingdonia uniflora]
MSFIMVSIPALLSAIIILLKIILVAPHLETQSQSICRDQNNNKLICDLEEMKLKIAKLESILEESVRSLSSNVNYLEEKGKLVEEMPHKIDFLKTALTNLKVQLLWAASRKNNFDILILESKAHDAEVRLEAVTKKVEKVKTIVTEQWIQIRQLDQALQVIEVRTSKIQKKKGYTINTFLKVCCT